MKAKRVIPFHEVANIFPLMEGEEFDALVEDIRVNGLRESIWTYEGKIIDGRNRYNACLRSEVEPAFREWDGVGSPVSFVVSLNLHRRHLSESQRAMIAENLAQLDRGGQRANASIEAFSQSEAAKMLNVSRSAVQRAGRVVRHGDEDLISAVKSGDITVAAAVENISAAEKYPEVAAIIPKSRPHELAKIANNLDAMSEPERDEKIKRLIGNDMDVLRELTNRTPVPQEPKNRAKEWAEWVLDARRKLSQVRNASFREGVLTNWTESGREAVLEAVDLFIEDLQNFKGDVLGGIVYDECTEEAGIEAVLN